MNEAFEENDLAEMSSIDSQLVWLVNSLSECGINYWLDSGSLLGLVREGKLLEHDGDIDVGLLSGQEKRMGEFLSNAKDEGYRCRRNLYKGEVFKFKLESREETAVRIIDINVFKAEDNHLWCPQEKAVKSLERRKLLLVPLIKCVERFLKSRDYEKFPLSLRGMYTWWIPSDLVLPTQKYEDIGISVPSQLAAYLEFRYGNWQIPNKNWSFWNDDGGLNKARPEELVDLPTKRRSKR